MKFIAVLAVICAAASVEAAPRAQEDPRREEVGEQGRPASPRRRDLRPPPRYQGRPKARRRVHVHGRIQ
ncbi:hypothetical protein THAOC_07063, partial [Thalassiosira oceanica]